MRRDTTEKIWWVYMYPYMHSSFEPRLSRVLSDDPFGTTSTGIITQYCLMQCFRYLANVPIVPKIIV